MDMRISLDAVGLGGAPTIGVLEAISAGDCAAAALRRVEEG
jgi:hypothetical protein